MFERYSSGPKGLMEPIMPFLEKPNISELLINAPGSIWVEREGEMKSYDVPSLTEPHLLRLFQLIANENEQIISKEKPLLSGQLHDGTRVQLVMTPTARYPAMSVRRKVTRKRTLSHYQLDNFYQKLTPCDIHNSRFQDLSRVDQQLVNLYHKQNWHAFIQSAVMEKKNIVISGGTSSGKTTYLNACLAHIPLTDRIIVLEDTREIETAHPNLVQLLASKGDQGLAKISMQDLVQCCLRLRPDRIIMGEIRGKEIMDFVSACSTGHEGSITTIHANNPRVAFMRMTQMYKLNNVPSMTDDDIMRELKEVIDIVIQLNKTPYGRLADSVYYKHMNVKPE